MEPKRDADRSSQARSFRSRRHRAASEGQIAWRSITSARDFDGLRSRAAAPLRLLGPRAVFADPPNAFRARIFRAEVADLILLADAAPTAAPCAGAKEVSAGRHLAAIHRRDPRAIATHCNERHFRRTSLASVFAGETFFDAASAVSRGRGRTFWIVDARIAHSRVFADHVVQKKIGACAASAGRDENSEQDASHPFESTLTDTRSAPSASARTPALGRMRRRSSTRNTGETRSRRPSGLRRRS